MKKLFILAFLISLFTTASHAAVGPIVGPLTTCVGSSVTLTDTTAGGIWVSSTSAVAVVGSMTGVVTGISAGTSTISYLSGAGIATAVFTVMPVPAAISGPSIACVGGPVTLSDATAGGTWVSGTPTIASVDVTTGVVTGLSAGIVNIYYVVGGCGASKTMTINAALPAISGSNTICAGSTTTYTDAVSGGIWASSSPATGTITTSTGVFTGITPGVTIIFYSAGACTVTKTVTVLSTPAAIVGAGTVCAGTSITLTNTTPGGTWTSSSTLVATVGSGTGIVSGTLPGVTTITYFAGGCSVTKSVTVNAAPSAISGPGSVCVGGVVTLADAVPGGLWSVTSTSVATIGSITGVVAGVSTGVAIVTYNAGGCSVTTAISVNPVPAAITGSSTVCEGSTITLSDATAGGTWLSGSAATATVSSATGVVTGVAPGVVNIYYSIGGCGASHTISVNPAPAAITGSTNVCVGSTITLSDATSGGAWLSGDASVATVSSSSGVVTGVAAGTVDIYYSLGGCDVSYTISVNPVPAAISGPSSVCVGSSITLTDATSGGSWLSGSTAIATVVSITGIVTGVAAGTVNIYYSVGGCGAYKIVSVNTCSGGGTDTGGIDGGITEGEGKGTSGGVPVIGMLVRLKKASNGLIVSQVYTNAAGKYSFSGIAAGSYYVYPENVGYTTTPSATITISSSSRHHSGIDFIVRHLSKTITPGSTGVQQLTGNNLFSIFPNPSTGNISISWNGMVIANASVVITDVIGREVARTAIGNAAVQGSAELNLAHLNNGIYTVSIKSETTNYTSRIFISK